MVIQGFDPIEYTILDLVDFIKRMEATDNANGNKMGGNDGTARKNHDRQETKKRRGRPLRKEGSQIAVVTRSFIAWYTGPITHMHVKIVLR